MSVRIEWASIHSRTGYTNKAYRINVDGSLTGMRLQKAVFKFVWKPVFGYGNRNLHSNMARASAGSELSSMSRDHSHVCILVSSHVKFQIGRIKYLLPHNK